MSPSPEHGQYESLLEDFVLMFCETFRIPLEKCGRATWRRQSLSKGAEADASFYIKSAGRIIGRKINLESDPPPDIVVEIDVTNSSLRKLSIHVGLGISEVWRYDGHVCRFYILVKDAYRETRISRCLPGLTGPMIADSIELSKTQGQDEARKAFRRRIKALKKGPPS